jgi:hypothetical protein
MKSPNAQGASALKFKLSEKLATEGYPYVTSVMSWSRPKECPKAYNFNGNKSVLFCQGVDLEEARYWIPLIL